MSDRGFNRAMGRNSRAIGQTIVKEVPIYDEGTFVPVLFGSTGAGTFTYDATNTHIDWTRIGNRVLVNGRIRITAIPVAPAGAMRISTLPFTSATTGFSIAGEFDFLYQGITLPAGYTQAGIAVIDTVTYMALQRAGSNVAVANVLAAEIVLVGGVLDFRIGGEYQIAVP